MNATTEIVIQRCEHHLVRGEQERLAPLREHRPPIRRRRLHAEPEERQSRQIEQRVTEVQVDCATIVGATFGRTCASAVRPPLNPWILHASTYGFDRSARTTPRTTRASSGMYVIAIAIVAVRKPAPNVATMTMASRSGGKREHQIPQAREDGVHEPASVAGEQAERHADGGRDDDDEQRPEQAQARADDDPGEDVAARIVGAERMRKADRAEAVDEVDRIGIVRHDPLADQRNEDEHRDDGGRRDHRDARARRGQPAPAERGARPVRPTRLRDSSAQPDARVDDSVQHVDDDVDRYEARGEEQGDRLHDGEVLLQDSGDEQAAEAVQAERVLDSTAPLIR